LTADAYVLEGNKLVLKSSTTSGILRMRYFIRPNRLVTTDSVGEITAINTTTHVVTVSVLPSTFITSVTYDLVKGKPGFDTLAMDQSVSAVGTNTLTFSTLPTGLAVGDFVCLAGESPVVQAPVELHPLTVQRTVVAGLAGLGDAKVKVAAEMAEQMKTMALSLLSPRIVNAPKVIVNRNGPGWKRR
jgi:hypothetical protein